MKILVTGASGLLGYKVVQIAIKRKHEVYSIYRDHPIVLGVPIKLDLTEVEKVIGVISKIRPDVIIHTAAYTDVDGCEVDRELAWRINAEATKYLSLASANADSHLIYVSTDYVFDGNKGLYTEEDRPNPVNYYGYTKLMGEQYVENYAEDWCIARTSAIYGWGGFKHNFATWLINNLSRGKTVNVLIDQYVSPTLNTNLAEMLLEIAERKMTGVIHTAGATRVSRYEFSLKLAEEFNLTKDLIRQVKMSDMTWKAKRPRDSSLDVNKACIRFKIKPLSLRKALKNMKKEASIIKND